MRRYFWIIAFCIAGTAPAMAVTTDVAAQNAATWLVQNQNRVDGSWGAAEALKPLMTAEAVIALRAFNQRSQAYYAGITWLENHRAANIDYKSRRVLALAANGDDVSAELAALAQAQNLVAPGNSGWGLTGAYQGATVDTALALQALNRAGVSTNVAAAITYLKSAQLTGIDKGWALAQETTSDPMTTAQAILALAPYKATDATLVVPMANGIASLGTNVGITSPAAVQAVAALAYFSQDPNSAAGASLLSNLAANQGLAGDLGGDPYLTALALRGFSVVLGKDLAAQRVTVVLPDENLRAAINQALGRNSLDALNVGELAKLTSLDISNRGIKDLTGLQFAVNLVSLNAVNNQITSTAPLSGLTHLTSVQLAGNPVSAVVTADSDVPTLPEWGMIIMALALLASMGWAKRKQSGY